MSYRHSQRNWGIIILWVIVLVVVAVSCKDGGKVKSSAVKAESRHLSGIKSVKPKSAVKKAKYFGKIGDQSLSDLKNKTLGYKGHACKKASKKMRKDLAKQFRCQRQIYKKQIRFFVCENDDWISRRKQKLSKLTGAKRARKEEKVARMAATYVMASTKQKCNQALNVTLDVKTENAQGMLDAFQTILEEEEYEETY